MRMDDGGAAAGGTLVIRTWFELGREPGFRARITYSHPAGRQNSVAAGDPNEVLEVVRQWLEAQHADRDTGGSIQDPPAGL
ncbi:hypothetical protein [Pseudarthrobacter sp. NS4]|uniref:hypothetical protein n=1 Tax=Pseudarthrobacter sp. NS4 TaxID=2973976 RepID=UPI002161450E|nr:hypothetical protein [Pseudarthrobacter sp. NS4]